MKQNFATSDACTEIGPSENQRRAPLTDFPIPGINTAANSTTPPAYQGAAKGAHPASRRAAIHAWPSQPRGAK